MKKYLFVLALLGLFGGTAKAQYHDTTSCNRDFTSGFSQHTGSGPSGSFNTRFFIQAHYVMVNQEQVKQNLVTYSTMNMNDYAAANGYSVRFNGLDWSATPTDPGQGKLNFTVYMDIYHYDSGLYQVFICFHGWGVGHLFRTLGEGKDTPEAAILSALQEATKRVGNGWTCAN
jgi:hypothetical protein